MRKLLMICLFALVFPTIEARSLSTPKAVYTVAYPLQWGDGIRVATLQSDDSWSIETLPRALFAEGYTQLTAPQWTPDGRTMYATAFPSSDNRRATSIIAYDVLARKSSVIGDLHAFDTDIEYVTLGSLSPDAQYAWVDKPFSDASQLLNLAQKRGLPPLDCSAYLLAWTTDWAVVFDSACEEHIRLLALATRTQIKEFSDVDADLYFVDAWQTISTGSKPYVLGGPQGTAMDGRLPS